MMDDDELIAHWKQDEQQPFSGWDFSYLEGRYFEPVLPWSYEDRVRQLLVNADSVLDMGTGGGEKLLGFKDLLPPYTFATEGWLPNIPVARRQLEPHGIKVLPYDSEKDDHMPFENQSFALIINRHESYDLNEITRILKPGGRFLTQQVDGSHMADLASVFGLQPSSPQITLAICIREVEQAGLQVEYAHESMGKMKFTDVGALVYYAHAAPWDVPEDFSVERYTPLLLELHHQHRLSFDMGHFIIQAHKPAS